MERDKLLLLEEKVSRVISRIENLKQANAELRDEKAELEGELASITRKLDKIHVGQNDRASLIKSKLSLVLQRIEELEKITT